MPPCFRVEAVEEDTFPSVRPNHDFLLLFWLIYLYWTERFSAIWEDVILKKTRLCNSSSYRGALFIITVDSFFLFFPPFSTFPSFFQTILPLLNFHHFDLHAISLFLFIVLEPKVFSAVDIYWSLTLFIFIMIWQCLHPGFEQGGIIYFWLLIQVRCHFLGILFKIILFLFIPMRTSWVGLVKHQVTSSGNIFPISHIISCFFFFFSNPITWCLSMWGINLFPVLGFFLLWGSPYVLYIFVSSPACYLEDSESSTTSACLEEMMF